jgi:hypothetical protein
MPLLRFDCSICKKLYGDGRREHLITKGAELTEHEWFAQCSGCGAFSVKLFDDGLVAGLADI